MGTGTPLNKRKNANDENVEPNTMDERTQSSKKNKGVIGVQKPESALFKKSSGESRTTKIQPRSGLPRFQSQVKKDLLDNKCLTNSSAISVQESPAPKTQISVLKTKTPTPIKQQLFHSDVNTPGMASSLTRRLNKYLHPRPACDNAAVLFDVSFSINEESVKNLIASKLSKTNCNNFNYKVKFVYIIDIIRIFDQMPFI